MSKVELVIYGEPVGKQRPRVSMANGVVRTYTPKKTTTYENLIAHEYTCRYKHRQFEMNEPIAAYVIAYFGLNKGDYGKKGLNKSGKRKLSVGFATTHIDIDNVLKSVFDALNGICYYDDKQIVQVIGVKRYTQDTPRVEIRLESIETDVCAM